LGSGQGGIGCLQTVDRGRYARLKKVLAQTLAQELCNLLRIKTGFNFAGENRNTRLQFVNIAEHFLLGFIRELPMQIKHFLRTLSFICNILWRVAGGMCQR